MYVEDVADTLIFNLFNRRIFPEDFFLYIIFILLQRFHKPFYAAHLQSSILDFPFNVGENCKS